MKEKFLLLISSFMFIANSYGQSGQEGNVSWNIIDSTLTISGSGNMIDYPSYYYPPWNNYKNLIKNLVIEENITSVGNYAFQSCDKTINVEILGNITKIGEGAFRKCFSLASINIPNSVTNIDNYSFNDCLTLTSIELPNSVTTIGAYAFGGCINLTNIEIPESVTTIDVYAFQNTKFAYIEIPNSITIIKEGTFCGSTLQRIKLPNSIITIENNAFLRNPVVESIDIPNGVTTIGVGAFAGCYSLTNIKIPSSITDIGVTAFSNCNSLKSVDVYWEEPLFLNKNIFTQSYLINATLIVPAGTKALYEATPIWKDFGTITERVLVTSISVSPKTATLMAGSSLQLVATISPSNATNQNVTWSSSNNTVATVDATGKVMAVGGGSATITVTTDDGGMTATFNVTVFEIAVTSVTLNTVVESIFIGDTLQLTATVNPSYASNKTITWSSSNSTVATVDATGKVTGVSEGTTTITATSNNGKTATCMVTVSQLTNYVTIEIPIGDTGEFIVFDIERSAGSDEVNSFVMGFPEGLDIDPESVILTETLSEGLVLTVIPLGYNTWLFEVSAPSTFSLRSAMSLSQTTPISYRITGSVANAYEIVLCDVNTALSSGINIPKYELIPTISTMAGETVNSQIEAGYITAIIANGSLIIETPYNETVKVYSIAGTLAYTTEKTEGKVSYSVSNIPNGIYVVTGSNGWSIKALKK